MKEEDGNLTSVPVKSGSEMLNKEFVVFTFFLFLSNVIRYLYSLGKENETGIICPLKSVHLPEETNIDSEQPVSLTLFLKDSGYSVLKHRIPRGIAQRIIDISRINFKNI